MFRLLAIKLLDGLHFHPKSVISIIGSYQLVNEKKNIINNWFLSTPTVGVT